MFFKFHTESEGTETPPPRPVYAKIDQVEDSVNPELATVMLDCVDSGHIDSSEFSEPLHSLEDNFVDDWLSIISIELGRMKELGVEEVSSSRWYKIELEAPEYGPYAEQFFNLFQDPTPRGVISITEVSDAVKKKLDWLAGWNGIEASSPERIAKALYIGDTVDAVGIYDVGQGACAALIRNELPALYLDFGGSALGNWRSFPSPLKRFCFSAKPPIVLSHWDWDHWSSALRDNESLSQTWILPVQSAAGPLGGVHARFIAQLNAHGGTLLWWSSTLDEVLVGTTGFSVTRAGGPPSNRNESGLAIKGGTLPGPDAIEVLLPADASLRYLDVADKSIHRLMVPHHGGHSDWATEPKPYKKTTSAIIYSYGVASTYLHPLDPTVHILRRNWKKNFHTALRDESGLGHVGISLNQRARRTNSTPCGGYACQLCIRQWL